MLKVKVDMRHDYLDYLRPFVLHVLVRYRPERVTDQGVCDALGKVFGLAIPPQAVQIVLRRLARAHNALRRKAGVFVVSGELPDPGIDTKKAEAANHIQSVVDGLINYARDQQKAALTDDEAIGELCDFLAAFNIECLRVYLQGTALPQFSDPSKTALVRVSDYVVYLQRDDPKRFESFLILLQGHMLANGLLCPDLVNAPKSYRNVGFYLDTPLLVRLVGLEGDARESAAKALVAALRELGGSVLVFEHTRYELEHVVRGAADHLDSADAHGAIVTEARRRRTSRADILLMAGKLDELLEAEGVRSAATPRYEIQLQIDEESFGQALDDEVSYYNQRARDYDINSVRSIHVLRAGRLPRAIEDCKAVLVTTNAAFARAAYDFGQTGGHARGLSSVITDFSLANMAWLKAPLAAPSVPRTELMAYAYAALQPSRVLLQRYMSEMDRLEHEGTITPRDHQLLRSSVLAQDELVSLTLGDEQALTEETMMETLRRVQDEMTGEERARTEDERAKRVEVESERNQEREKNDRLRQHIYQACLRKAKIWATAVSVLVGAVLVVGILGGLGIRAANPWLGWFLSGASAFVVLFSIINFFRGATIRDMHSSVTGCLLNRFVQSEAQRAGVELVPTTVADEAQSAAAVALSPPATEPVERVEGDGSH